MQFKYAKNKEENGELILLLEPPIALLVVYIYVVAANRDERLQPKTVSRSPRQDVSSPDDYNDMYDYDHDDYYMYYSTEYCWNSDNPRDQLQYTQRNNSSD